MNKNKLLNIIMFALIITIVVVLILIGTNFYQNKVSENSYLITLLGLDNMVVYKGDWYNEPGYIARDMKGHESTSLVKISGDVNTNVIGEYKITYSINSFFKKNEVVRTIKVVENPLENIIFSLKGNNYVNFNLYDQYQEYGFTCVDKNGIDYSNSVNISNNVLMNKIGNYTINYTLKIGEKEKILTRVVNVSGPSYEYSLDNEKLVNTDVIIKFQSNINNLDYVITPKGERIYNDLINYRVSRNGTYRFVMYDKNGVMENVNVLINNIDKEIPVGSCKSIIDGNVTSYSVTASDNGKIVKYVLENYQNNAYTTGNFVINSKIENGVILVYDDASNYARITCDTDYSYIGVNGSSSYQYISESLKYWIEKESSYYVFHIWVEDPYNQLKTALPSPFGTLSSAYNILKNEISNKGYANKGMVAINGSGFVSEQFDQSFYRLIPAWKNSAVTPIVIHDSNIIRNFTNQVLPSNNKYSTYGLTSDGVLKYYSFTVNNIAYNQQTAQNMINDGVKYTFGFKPVLVSNGKRVVSDAEVGINRQAICQINKNNFVIIGSSYFSLNQIADKMISLGCHTGLNLDGGGSINSFYKGNTNKINSLRTVPRALADILYFVER